MVRAILTNIVNLTRERVKQIVFSCSHIIHTTLIGRGNSIIHICMYKINTNFPILSASCSSRSRRAGCQTGRVDEGVYRLPACVLTSVYGH